ncbi:MAG TPA: alcohol dehydrogenase catalytic domain-containing protein [Bacteroidales bacterium]|nr:alcohol dehydrogenase catalytic domain-containing protein [Bacteroidales bacterium]
MNKMHAAVLEEYGRFEWKQVAKPEIADNEVLVKVSYAGICGSDQHIFKGEFHPRTTIPFVPGHEFAGVITAAGSKVTKYKTGEHVAVDPIIWCGKCPACLRKHYPACSSLKLLGVDMNGGFGEYINVPEQMLYRLDPSIPLHHAALVEVLSIGFHACRRADVQKDDTVVIWGAGKVGQSILQAVRTKTINTVIMVDILEKRLNLAKSYYPDIIAVNARNEKPVERIRDITGGKGVDIAIEAVGHHFDIGGVVNPVRGCIQSIRGAGTVCVLGLGDEPLPLLMKELIWKEAKIVASRVSHGEFAETIENLGKGTLKPDALVTDVLSPDMIQHGFELLEEEPENHLKILLKFV